MKAQSTQTRLQVVWTIPAVLIIVSLACSLPGASNPSTELAPTQPDATKMYLEIQATMQAEDATRAALVPPTLPPTEMSAATYTPYPTYTAPPQSAMPTLAPPTPEPTATVDIAVRMKAAKILVYEDAVGIPLEGYVRKTLDLMGLKYTYDGDALGHFMEHLNSGTKWDLIIVAGEARSGVQGEFFDILTPKVLNDNTALILELWYLDSIAYGKIQGLTDHCGIAYQAERKEVDSIYTINGSHPIFTTPNSGFSLTNYSTYWLDEGGDYVRTTGTGDAELIAGNSRTDSARSGMLTACIDGRVVIQTFSSHDYPRSTMLLLWENYITYVLTNHFAQQP